MVCKCEIHVVIKHHSKSQCGNKIVPTTTQLPFIKSICVSVVSGILKNLTAKKNKSVSFSSSFYKLTRMLKTDFSKLCCHEVGKDARILLET